MIVDGKILPWLNGQVLKKLLSLHKKSWRVFEYGSGHSTLWWQDEVKEIISVEHNKNFYRLIKKDIKDNCKYLRRDLIKKQDCAYVQSINEFEGNFDCIIVDGRNRSMCVEQAIGRLNKNGLIILDNSERERYSDAIKKLNDTYPIYLKAIGDKTNGVNPFCWCTTVWKNKK